MILSDDTSIRNWELARILRAGFEGGEAALDLALTITDTLPCKSCGYVHYNCKCGEEQLTGFVLGYN